MLAVGASAGVSAGAFAGVATDDVQGRIEMKTHEVGRH
jgi:hypothetical protein